MNKTRLKIFFIVSLSTYLLAGCTGAEIYPPKYRSSNVDFLPEIKYMKDKAGLCFAYTTSVVDVKDVVMSISNVSCTSVGL
jgi:hypothetical protein